jgi:nitrogen fixation/metabolism regulation signal transduction histidine kinase
VEFFQKAHGARFNFRVTFERGLFAARFDEANIQQALTKILENAIESFGANGNGEISVQTRNLELTEPTQDLNVRLATGVYVCIEISD